MRCLSVSFLLLLAISSSRAYSVGEYLSVNFQWLFCSYEEAPFHSEVTYPGFVERTYPARKWVCSEEESASGTETMEQLFWRLFSYIAGENGRESNIPMAVPVTTEFTAGGEKSNYKMCFFIPEASQGHPPIPTDPRIVINNRPEMTIYTRTVGGYMHNEEDWLTEAATLVDILRANGITTSYTHMFWAGYDSPMKFLFRRNEVWFVKQ